MFDFDQYCFDNNIEPTDDFINRLPLDLAASLIEEDQEEEPIIDLADLLDEARDRIEERMAIEGPAFDW